MNRISLLTWLVAVVTAPPLCAQDDYFMPNAEPAEGILFAVADLTLRQFAWLWLPGPESERFLAGSAFRLVACDPGWCYVESEPDRMKGYVLRDELRDEDEPLELALRRLTRAGYHTEWSSVEQMYWSDFINETHRLDRCARVLAYRGEDGFNPMNDWPGSCNDFRWTSAVQNRTAALREYVATLSGEDRQRVIEGKIWVGASSEIVTASWGPPEDVNRTTTAAGTREQWVYGIGTYVYLEDGRVTAIQN